MQNEFGLHKESKHPYFEGWYIKGMQEDIIFSIIIGIQYQSSQTLAFIQFMDTIHQTSVYEVYEEPQLYVQSNPFILKLKDTILTEDSLHLCMESIQADLVFDEKTALTSSRYMPTIMGPFAYLPMQCHHAVISLHHQISGRLTMREKSYDINGIGYIEKDRGPSFPSQYVWFQANHTDRNTGLFLSIADIPLKPISFTGIIAVLYVNDKQYRFASYLGAHIQQMKFIQKDEVHVDIIIKQRQLCLKLHLIQKDICELHAPYEGDMHIKIGESLNSVGHVIFSIGKNVIYEDTFMHAGLEIVGYPIEQAE